MGVVYEAYDKERDMTVALKTMRHLEAGSLYHFKREFRAISDLSHPNIVALYELVADEEDCYFTMEVVHGLDILKYVREGRTVPRSRGERSARSGMADGSGLSDSASAVSRNLMRMSATGSSTHTMQGVTGPAASHSGPLPSLTSDARLSGIAAQAGALALFGPFVTGPLPYVGDIVDMSRVRQVFAQLAQALSALHQVGLVHRDLKPANVRVTEAGRVVLMDFGIVAPESKERGQLRSKRAVGTPAYMAPEQARGMPASAAVDWYAFGIMLYEALTAERPYKGSPLEVLRAKMWQRPRPVARLVQGVPAALHSLCIRLLAKEPDERPTGEDIMRALSDGRSAPVRPSIPPRYHPESDVFVGRQAELGMLRRAYERSCAGAWAWVFVSAPSGMGKTALVRNFLAEILGRARVESSSDHLEPEISAERISAEKAQPARDRKAGPLVLRGRCHERETLAYNVFDGVIDGLSHTLLNMPGEREELLPADIACLARLFPVLRRVPEVEERSGSEGSAEAGDIRYRAAVALRSLLDNLSAQGPIVIHIDDMHWADGDSLELLAHLTAERVGVGSAPVRVPRVLFVGTLRSVEPDSAVGAALARFDRQSEVTLCALSPLAADERRELKERLDIADVDIADVDTTGAQSASGESVSGAGAVRPSPSGDAAGVPLFLVELARYVSEAGADVENRSMSLDQVLQHRIVRLPEDARKLLQATCVAFDPLPLRLLSSAARLGPEVGERALTHLRSRNLVVVHSPIPEQCVAPYDERVRRAVISRLTPRRHTKLNRRVAQRLDRFEHASLGARAHHWREAGLHERARTYLVEAAELAQGKLAFDRAAELYEQAVSLAPKLTMEETYDFSESSIILGGTDVFDEEDGAARIAGDERELRFRWAGALSLAGRHFEAATVYVREAEELASEDAAQYSDEIVELRRLAAGGWLRSGHVRRGLAGLAEVLAAIGVRYPNTRAKAIAALLSQRARLKLRGRKYQPRPAAELPERELARLDTLYAAASTLGFIDHLRGAVLQSYHLAGALKLGEERRVQRALAVEAAFTSSRPGRARASGQVLTEQVLAWARERDDHYLVGVTQFLRGGMLLFAGRITEAVEALRESDAVLGAVAEPVEWERVTARYMLCLALTVIGEFVDAAHIAERYTAVAERRNDVYARTIFMALPTVRWQLCQDRPDRAELQLTTLLDGWPDDSVYVAHYLHAFSHGLIALYRRDQEAAVTWAERTLERADRLMLTRIAWVDGEIHSLLGRAAILADKPARVRKSIRVIGRVQTRHTDGVVALLQAALRLREGDRERARIELEQALEHFEEVSARHLAAACRVRLADVLSSEGRGQSVSDSSAAPAADSSAGVPERRDPTVLRAAGLAALRECGARAPERMVDHLAPMFSVSES